jgi:hypothetical protein
MFHRLAATTLLVMLVAVAPLSGQRASAPLEQWKASPLSPSASSQSRGEPETMSPRRDYRYEGLLIGGLVLGAAGAWAGSQIGTSCALSVNGTCDNDKLGSAVGLGLISAVVGGGVGYLIGRLSPKVPRPPLTLPEAGPLTSAGIPDSVRQPLHYQHWRGGALGLTIGAAVGVATGALFWNGRCADCTHQPSGALTGGLIGAGAGGVLGFFAGLASPKRPSD